MKNRKQIELILILVVTAILANLLNDLIEFEAGYMVYNQMLFFTIGYICIAKLCDIKRIWNSAMHLGQLILLFLSASLYYSKNIIDYTVFGVCVYVTVITIMFLQFKRDTEEIK